MSTYWRGALLDERMAAQMDQVAALVPPGTLLRPTQGSWSGGVAASGGTHDGGGAVDLAGQDPGMDDAMRAAIRDAMRQVGIAAWVRTPAQSDWPYHVHGISVQPGGKHDRGCLSSGAASQVVDYYEGRNGLASGAPDDGPRTWVGVTWETYRPARPQWEDDTTMALSPEALQQINDIVANVLRAAEFQLQATKQQTRTETAMRTQLAPGAECYDRVRQACNQSIQDSGLTGT